MNLLMDMYNGGIIYKTYLDHGKDEDKQKHLHYLQKVKFTEEDIHQIKQIKKHTKLLVFCNILCNDCRITLAVLENIRKLNPLVQYKIVDREGNRALMQTLSGEQRIPLIIRIQDNHYEVIFTEFPDVVRDMMKNSADEEKENLKLKFRKGFYNDKILQQFLSYLV
jgi:hypothetical protein